MQYIMAHYRWRRCLKIALFEMVIYLVIIAGGIEGHVNIYRHVLLTMVWVELAATINS